MNRLTIAMVVLAPAPVFAHHAFASEFDLKRPLKLRGTVAKMDWSNPHSWIYLDVRGADGRVVTWMMQGGSPGSLGRLGFTKVTLPEGTDVEIDGFQSKDGSNRGAGTVVVFGDGRKQFVGGSAPGAKPVPKGSHK